MLSTLGLVNFSTSKVTQDYALAMVRDESHLMFLEPQHATVAADMTVQGRVGSLKNIFCRISDTF